jgi:hypothetical protein
MSAVFEFYFVSLKLFRLRDIAKMLFDNNRCSMRNNFSPSAVRSSSKQPFDREAGRREEGAVPESRRSGSELHDANWRRNTGGVSTYNAKGVAKENVGGIDGGGVRLRRTSKVL